MLSMNITIKWLRVLNCLRRDYAFRKSAFQSEATLKGSCTRHLSWNQAQVYFARFVGCRYCLLVGNERFIPNALPRKFDWTPSFDSHLLKEICRKASAIPAIVWI